MENVNYLIHACSFSPTFMGMLKTIQTVIFFSSFLSDGGIFCFPYIIVFHISVCWGYF